MNGVIDELAEMVVQPEPTTGDEIQIINHEV